MSTIEKLHKKYRDYKIEHGTIGLKLSRLLDNGFHHARREHQDMEVELAELREDRKRLDALIRWMSKGHHMLPPGRPAIDHAIEVEADSKRRMEVRDAT